MSSKAAVGVLKPARVRARNSAKHQERGGWVGAPYEGFRFKTAAEQGCDWETTAGRAIQCVQVVRALRPPAWLSFSGSSWSKLVSVFSRVELSFENRPESVFRCDEGRVRVNS